VQRGIGKHRIKAPLQGELLGLHPDHVQAAHAARVKQLQARVDTDDRACGGDLFGERAIAATKIQDQLAGGWGASSCTSG
jgi:hypothetical protein